MIRNVLMNLEVVKEYFSTFDLSEFSFDTETDGLIWYDLEITGISFCNKTNACYIPIHDDNREAIVYFLKHLFKKLTKDNIVIAHNWVFDASVLYKYSVKIPTCRLFDTMIACHLIDENGKKGLKHLTRTILNKEVTDYNEVGEDHYTDKFYQYGIDDAVNTFELYLRFKEDINNKKLVKLFRLEMNFQRVLLEMKIEGVLVDRELVKEQTEKLVELVKEFTVKLYEYLGDRYELQFNLNDNTYTVTGCHNFNSNHNLADILFNRLGLEIIESTETGLPKTGKFTLSRYKTHPFVKLLNKYKIASKLLSGFFNPLPSFIEGDGKIRPSFIDHGTKTGRLSCRNPNLQQLPKQRDELPTPLREAFIAPRGYKMITCDYSGQEIAVMAQVSKDPTLINFLKHGHDMHLAIANQFYNLNIPRSAK